jgi:hypothetical protein
MTQQFFDVVAAVQQFKQDVPKFREAMFLKAIGISKQAFHKHKKDPSMKWCIDHARKIAVFFHVSVDRINIYPRPQGQKRKGGTNAKTSQTRA